MKQWTKRHRVGEVSSKYGYQPEQFGRDLENKKDRAEALWAEFIQWVKDHELTPEDARRLLMRVHEELL